MLRRTGEVDMRRLLRAALAAILAALLVVASGFAPASGWAAPKKNQRCPEVPGAPFDWSNVLDSDSDIFEFPAGATPRTFEYQDPAGWLSYESEPTLAQMRKIGTKHKKYDPSKVTDPTLAHEIRRKRMIARWYKYQAGNGTLTWEQWRDRYIRNQSNVHEGEAFENLVRDLLGLSGSTGWRSQARVPKSPVRRDWDFLILTVQCRLGLEVKAGASKIKKSQLDKDGSENEREKTLPESERVAKVQVVSERPTRAEAAAFKKAGVKVFVIQAEGVPVPPPTPGANPPAPAGQAAKPDPQPKDDGGGGAVMTAPGEAASDGGLVRALAGVPATKAEAEEDRKVSRELADDWADPEDMPDDTGGIDFSTLELRYIADPTAGDAGLKYSFSAKPTADGQLSWGGLAAAQQASDAFFVWMALRPEHFWVNLNPNEPDRIIEERLGATDAGRVLLEADLQMKKTVAKLIHPDATGGQRFWDSLRNTDDEQTCLSFRQWIVPDTATVHEHDGGLYIVDAPLIVKSETEYFDGGDAAEGTAAGCRPGDEATEKHNAEVFRSQILTKVQEAVNTAPEYAELRRVYLSRVAAEWYRQRSTNRNTAFAGIVNSGDVSRWPSRTGWKPREVFDRYVKSYTDGEFDVTRETALGTVIETHTYIYGGVDFSQSPRSEVGAAAFGSRWGGLPSTVADSMAGTVEDDGRIWLGGASADRPTVPFKVTSVLTWAAGAVMALLVAALFVRSLWRQQRRRREWHAARR
jgi:hypothetical protein